ncbi:SAM-dependent methyltransferase [Mycolicibacterium anyangense]|uniref:SAM-dependent methyltransferase n=1 Tax=Mycolicibacterium anyangense TaxID=1431246 RepID=A0A6N4WCM2_9MYCO|nr:mycofactocin oligosaccharide methyltransferase MftM [Mycolicibacterium anyangense]BBZ79720.1 SAM-dependent methyltransferase [Mycolicibacterium anyangense]
MTTTIAPTNHVDALLPANGFRYENQDIVVTRRTPRELLGAERRIGRTRHFTLGRHDGRLVLVHDLDPAEVDNSICQLLVDELFTPGWVAGADTFERLFTGLVLTSHGDPLTCWELFYRNTLRSLDRLDGEGRDIPVFGHIYRYAEQLIATIAAGSLLDVGTCFGFLPLRVQAGSAGPVHTVIACDVLAGAARLLDQVSRRLDRPVRTLTCDAARITMDDESTDVVTVLHLLEHVDSAHGLRIIDEAVRVARRRVVIAVPLEDEPEPTYGHVRQISLADLRSLARQWPGWSGTVTEFHGGWLILDRVSPVGR